MIHPDIQAVLREMRNPSAEHSYSVSCNRADRFERALTPVESLGREQPATAGEVPLPVMEVLERRKVTDLCDAVVMGYTAAQVIDYGDARAAAVAGQIVVGVDVSPDGVAVSVRSGQQLIHSEVYPLPQPAARAGAGAEDLARRFHDTYERRAPEFGYETRPDTKAFDPSTPNGRLMIAVCGDILSGLGLAEAEAQPVKQEADDTVCVGPTCCIDGGWFREITVEGVIFLTPLGMQERAKRVLSAKKRVAQSLNLDSALRKRGLPVVADALGYSRNFAAANPGLSQTTKDHINGLCDMLELAAARPSPMADAEDAARLDWLAADMAKGEDAAGIDFERVSGKYVFPQLDNGAGGIGGGVYDAHFDTLRDAIDAAIERCVR